MGGICGFTTEGITVLPRRQAVLEAMAQTMEHRCRDGYIYFSDEGISLCMLPAGGDSRKEKAAETLCTDENGRYHLTCDATIYNHPQLRSELQSQGHIFRSGADHEVLVHLFEEIGAACPVKLRGPFAFALWDSAAKSLYLARDRFGIKPLYYAEAPDGAFVFASEAKALLQYPHITARLNTAALPHYLTFQYFPDPQCSFLGISRLLPAHHLTRGAALSKAKKYWEICFRPLDKPLDYFVENTAHLIRQSVRLHCGDEPTKGAFLSSGIDSTNIAALLRNYGDVDSFSVNCSGGKYDELTPARHTAQLLGTRHFEKEIGADEFWDALPRALWHQDEPVADPAAIALYFAARLAASEVKAVLSGEGADELFGGYEIYREPAALAPLQMLPSSLQGMLQRASRKLPEGIKGKSFLRRATTPLEKRYYGNAFIFSEEEKAALLNREFYPAGWEPPWKVTAPYYRKSLAADGTTRMQHLDFHTWLPGDILAKADRMSSAHSLEVRMPYLDHRLVEFAATIPPRYKIARGMTKYVLRMSTAGYLPGEIYRRPKLGFPVPLAAWIREHYRDRLHELWQSEPARTYFNHEALGRLLEEHCLGKADHGRKIWTLAIFLLWHRLYIK